MRISAIHTYPVKGCYRTDHREARVEPWGLAGDRRFMIVDEDDRLLTQREEPGLVRIKPTLDGDRLALRAAGHDELSVTPVAGERVATAVHGMPVAASPAGADADDWIAGVIGRKARLLWLDDPTRRRVVSVAAEPDDVVSLADGYPVLLATIASLAALNDWLAEAQSAEWPLPMTRFRPNLVVEGAPPWAEDGWIGHRVRIGGAVFRVATPCGRCIVTTTDQDTGERGREPLRTLARHRHVGQKLIFAVNLIPAELGPVAVGDAITVEP